MTRYGKFIRKLRVDLDLTLTTMAKDLEVSPAYLSLIERGKKPVPEDFAGRICELYKLSAEQTQELKEAIRDSRQWVRIDTGNDELSCRLLDALHDTIGSLTPETKRRMLRMLKK